MGSTNVTIRLSDEAWARFSAQAEMRGVALSAFLRQRLEQQEEFLETELALRARPAPAPEAKPAGPPLPPSVHLEMLLVLRQIAYPQKVEIARAELRRLGFELWEFPEPTRR